MLTEYIIDRLTKIRQRIKACAYYVTNQEHCKPEDYDEIIKTISPYSRSCEYYMTALLNLHHKIRGHTESYHDYKPAKDGSHDGRQNYVSSLQYALMKELDITKEMLDMIAANVEEYQAQKVA